MTMEAFENYKTALSIESRKACRMQKKAVR
jgi:hypothetical protein